jgi:hypothetical protein
MAATRNASAATKLPGFVKRIPRALVWPILVGLGCVVTAFVAFLVYLQTDDFQRRATALVEGAVELQTGEQLTLGGIHLDLWPPAVRIDGFNLWDDGTGESIATAEHIRAPIVLRDGGLGLGNVVLQHPVVQLHIGADGKLVEFENARHGSGEKKGPGRLPWSSLSIDEATVRLFFPDGTAEVTHLSVTSIDGPLEDVVGKLHITYKDLDVAAPLELRGVTLGPDRVDVPAIDLHTDPLDLNGEVNYPLGGELTTRLRGELRLEALQPLFVPPNALLGHVQFDVASSGPPDDPVVQAVILGDEVGYDKVGLHWPLFQYRFGTVSASLHATKDGADIEKAVFQWGDGQVIAWGRITRDLQVEDGHVLAENLSIDHVFRQFDAFEHPWVDMIGDAEVAVSGSLKPMNLTGPMDFALVDLRVTDGPIADPASGLMLAVDHGSLKGTFTLDAENIILDADTLTTTHSRGKARAVISRGQGPVDITADIWDADLRDLRPLGDSELLGRGHLIARIHGEGGKFSAEGDAVVDGFSVTGLPYADHLSAHVRTPDMVHLYFDNAKGIKGSTPYTGDLMLGFVSPMTMDLKLQIPRGGRSEDVVGVFVDLPGLSGEMGGDLWLKGPLYDLDGEAHLGLSATNLWGETFETGTGHGYMDHGVFTLDDLRVQRKHGKEGVILRGGVDRQWKLNMEAIGDGLRLEGLDHLAGQEIPITGQLGFVARIDNTLFDPSPHGRLSATDVRYAGKPVDDSLVRFDSRDGIAHYWGDILGKTVAVDGTLGLWGRQPYALSATFEDLPAHLAYPVAADGEPVQATLSGKLDLHGNFGDDPSPVDIVADATDVHVHWGRQDLHNEGAWHYEQHGRAFELERFALGGGATHFALAARGGDRPLEVQGSGRVDLDLLRMVVPGLARADGVGQVDVVAGPGPAGDAAAQVTVELRPGDVPLVRHDSFPGSFEDVTATLTGTRDGYDLVAAHANLGGGEVTARGHITAEGWVPKAYDLSCEARNSQVQWVDWLPPAVGDAELTFRGPSHALLLSGVVEIQDMTFSDRIDWEDWVVSFRNELLVDTASDDEPWFSFDVQLHAHDTIHLRNNLVEGTAKADLRLIGDTARPGLVGDVVVEDGIAYLQDREFVMDRGEIAFRDPWTWDPDLDFDLVTDITSRERRYRVNYLVLGPFSDWRTESRSDPALPQSDVNALLWFGMTAEELEEIGELPQAIGQGVADMVVAKVFVTNQTAQDLRGELPDLLDRVDLVTGVDSRGEYSPDPRLLVEKRLPELGNVDLTGEIDLARTGDQYWRVERPLTDAWSLSVWYATRQRDRSLPIGGAYGVDLRGRWEAE